VDAMPHRLDFVGTVLQHPGRLRKMDPHRCRYFVVCNWKTILILVLPAFRMRRPGCRRARVPPYSPAVHGLAGRRNCRKAGPGRLLRTSADGRLRVRGPIASKAPSRSMARIAIDPPRPRPLASTCSTTMLGKRTRLASWSWRELRPTQAAPRPCAWRSASRSSTISTRSKLRSHACSGWLCPFTRNVEIRLFNAITPVVSGRGTTPRPAG
jgi:hypothetical protein